MSNSSGSKPSATSAKSGRFTPKGPKDAGTPESKGAAAPASTGRYTPPQPRNVDAATLRETKPWVPWLMFALFAIGLILIVGNYLSLLPGSTSNWYLVGGIGAIAGGFLSATRLY